MAYDSTVNGFPYFSQNDPQWNSQRYGGKNIGSSGCGPTSAAMILKSFGENVTPADTAELFVGYLGGYSTTSGPDVYPAMCNDYGLECKNTKSISEVVTALKNGIAVIANPQGPCDFTGGGHYIVLCGITSDGRIRVNDPNGNHYEMSKTKTWTSDYIANCCVYNGGKDGFWIITKSGKGSIGAAPTSSSSAAVRQYTNFPKYSLSDDAIIEIAKLITGEQGGDDVLASRQEATQIANLNEVTYGRSNTEKDILRTAHSGWYNEDSFERGYTQIAIDAVRFVLVEGKRVLPRYCTEHDYFPVDAAISGHWYNGSREDRSQYVKDKTIVSQNPSSFLNRAAKYTFYCFWGSQGDKDICGYYSKDYPKYKDDIPWSEGMDETATEEYLYSENSYTEENKEPTVVWNNRTKESMHPKLLNMPTVTPKDKLCMYVSGNDITDYMGNLSWKNTMLELATTVTFETAKTDTKYITGFIHSPQVGDIVQMVTNAEVFRGVILSVEDGDRSTNKYTAADLGWYMNKTKQTYQFKNVTAKAAISELCADLSIPIAAIPNLDTNINQIYFDKTISDILSDILEQCGVDYNFDFVPTGIRIYKIGEYAAYPEFRIAPNLPQDYSPDHRGNVSHSTSMEDMRNSVKVTAEKDNVYKELAVKQNRELINKYGFLQEIVKIDEETENAQTVADETLKENASLNETYSFEIIEKYDSYTRAGETISIDQIKYVIESTNHSYENGWHKNKMDIRRL